MHPTAMENCSRFFAAYSAYFLRKQGVKVIEIGSQDVNGSLRSSCPAEFEYVGLDFQDAKGVDIILQDPYSLPFEDESIDIVLSSSCFEHSDMFWLVFLEVMRVLKPDGLFYLNVPSSGQYHRFPMDCWRFYPDSGLALVKWGQRNKVNTTLLESYVQTGGGWKDFVAVFLKDETTIDLHKDRILNLKRDLENGHMHPNYETIYNHNPF